MTDFEEIYKQYFQDVYRFVLKLSLDEAVAEEITQETFFKALRKIDSFDSRCKLSVWLCQIAKNAYFSRYQKQRKLMPLCDTSVAADTGDYSLEERIIDKNTSMEIHKVLHELSEPYKEVFTLRIFSNLSFSEIGQLFGKTDSWSRVTFYRAKNMIKEKLR